MIYTCILLFSSKRNSIIIIIIIIIKGSGSQWELSYYLHVTFSFKETAWKFYYYYYY